MQSQVQTCFPHQHDDYIKQDWLRPVTKSLQFEFYLTSQVGRNILEIVQVGWMLKGPTLFSWSYIYFHVRIGPRMRDRENKHGSFQNLSQIVKCVKIVKVGEGNKNIILKSNVLDGWMDGWMDTKIG